MENSDRQPSVQSSRGSKVIHIQTCKECKNHRSSTWHDEAKYEANYTQVKSAIESLTPEVTVERKVDGPFILGGFEIMHGKKVLFSKKTSGLWPNPQAVAQRVQLYFNDLDSGRDVSLYGTQREKAYTPVKKPRLGSAYSTGVGELNAFNSKYGNTGEGFSPEKQRNNDLHSSPETGYRETEEKNDEVEHHEHKEEKPDHHEEHITSTANQHQQDHSEVKHEHEAPHSPVKQEAPHQEHKHEEHAAAPEHHEGAEHAEPKSAEPKSAEPHSATSNVQQEGQAHPEPENKEESAGLPQNKSEVQEAHHGENKAEHPPAQEHKEEAAQENEEKVKAQKNPTEDEYPEDFAGN